MEAEGPCEEFVLTVELPEGFHEAEATLVDPFDRPITVTRPLVDIAVAEDTLARNVEGLPVAVKHCWLRRQHAGIHQIQRVQWRGHQAG